MSEHSDGGADARPAALDELSTESVRTELTDLATWSTLEAVRLFADEQLSVAVALRAAAHSIAAVVDAVAERLAAGGRLVYVGAGSSGRIAALDAAECGPTYGLHGRVVSVLAGGADAISTAREFFEDDEQAGYDDLDAVAPGGGDCVLGVSASGRTPYVLGAIRLARARGALSVALTNVKGSPLAADCDLVIEVDTGGEVIAGSTRLKAGSAQKTVLNTISTLLMVRLGRTYANLMVDVTADNAKLRRRARQVVARATGVDEATAARTLDEAGGQTKVAIVSLLGGVTMKQAVEHLTAGNGSITCALLLADNAPQWHAP